MVAAGGPLKARGICTCMCCTDGTVLAEHLCGSEGSQRSTFNVKQYQSMQRVHSCVYIMCVYIYIYVCKSPSLYIS